MSILKLNVVLNNGVRGTILFETGYTELSDLIDTTVTVTTQNGEEVRGTVYDVEIAA